MILVIYVLFLFRKNIEQDIDKTNFFKFTRSSPLEHNTINNCIVIDFWVGTSWEMLNPDFPVGKKPVG